MKRQLVIILIVFFSLLILILILLPGFAKRYVVKHSKEYIGRQFTIDRIRLNYFTSTVQIDGFKLYEADEKEVFVSFDQMLVNLQPLNILRNEIVIEKFYLTGLYANIIQQDSSFNFDDILEFFNKPSDSTEIKTDTTPSKPWGFRMSDFQLRQAHFVFDDRNVKKATHMQDFSFTVPYIAWNEGESDAGLKFTTARGGYLESSLKIDPVNGDYKASVIIERLYLDNFKEYLSYYTGIQSIGGIFNCRIELAGNINFPEGSIISGKIGLQDLAMTDTTGEKFLGADQIDIGLKKFDHAHSRYEFDSLILTGPYVHFILSDSTDNITEAFSMPEDALSESEKVADTSAADISDSLYYSLDAFVIEGGILDYTDNLTGEPFNYHLSDIILNADSIASDAGWLNLYSQMLLNERGILKAQVGFDPIDPMQNISLDYVINDFQLNDLNIYSRYYMGFPIILGDMYYKSETKIREGQLNSENKLVMTNVELGDKGGGIYDVPIKLALFILKDRYGVINLDVPVRGDLNDPQVRLGKIIWNTFKNLILKVATAPYDILAGGLGTDPKDLESIDFGYLDTALTAQRQRQLDLLLQLEEQKPGLGIELVYFNDVEKEMEVIATGDPQLKEEAEIQGLAELLAQSRIRVLANYLQTKSDSTRIKISVSNPSDPKNTGSLPVFRMIYSLQGNP